MASSSTPKKRHRRTKAELLQDPEYCRTHGLRPPKPQKAAKTSKPKAEKDATPVKKRHRRTKAELLQDPAYRKKHGLDDPKLTDMSTVPKVHAVSPVPAKGKPDKRGKAGKALTKDQKVARAERDALPKVYSAWERVQSLISEMERAVLEHLSKSDPMPREFLDLDVEATRMEDAFTRFESAVDKRGAEV